MTELGTTVTLCLENQLDMYLLSSLENFKKFEALYHITKFPSLIDFHVARSLIQCHLNLPQRYLHVPFR